MAVVNFIRHFQNYSILRLGISLVHHKLRIIEYFKVLEKLWLQIKLSFQRKKMLNNFINNFDYEQKLNHITTEKRKRPAFHISVSKTAHLSHSFPLIENAACNAFNCSHETAAGN